MALNKQNTPKTLLQEYYKEFWTEFNKWCAKDELFCKEFKNHPYASIRSYQDYSVGEPYAICAGINFKKHEISIAAYFGNVSAYKSYYESRRVQIEEKLDRRLKWTLHQTKGSAMIYESADFDESHGWEKAFEVIIEKMLMIRKAFQ